MQAVKSPTEKKAALLLYSYQLVEDLNESLGGKLGNLEANVSRAQRDFDSLSKMPPSKQKTEALESLINAKIELYLYRLELEVISATELESTLRKENPRPLENPPLGDAIRSLASKKTQLWLYCTLNELESELISSFTPSPQVIISLRAMNNLLASQNDPKLKEVFKKEIGKLKKENPAAAETLKNHFDSFKKPKLKTTKQHLPISEKRPPSKYKQTLQTIEETPEYETLFLNAQRKMTPQLVPENSVLETTEKLKKLVESLTDEMDGLLPSSSFESADLEEIQERTNLSEIRMKNIELTLAQTALYLHCKLNGITPPRNSLAPEKKTEELINQAVRPSHKSEGRAALKALENHSPSLATIVKKYLEDRSAETTTGESSDSEED